MGEKAFVCPVGSLPIRFKHCACYLPAFVRSLALKESYVGKAKSLYAFNPLSAPNELTIENLYGGFLAIVF